MSAGRPDGRSSGSAAARRGRSDAAGEGNQIDLFSAGARPASTTAVAASPVRPEDAQPAILSVSELTSRIKGLIEGGIGRISVGGELSNCRRQSSGHLYFTLKDGGATIGGVMWRQSAGRLKFEPKDGLQVVCEGRIDVYPPHGKYQLVADRIEPLGAGALALAFEQLKAKLEGEGLFEAGRKRPLPFLPRRIGVVTSPTGAALRDFLRVLHLRFPGLPVLVAPAKVQGEGSGAEVVAAIERLSAGQEVDVVVVTRGGGSMEDLWTFNEEAVARAIARCRVPVVSAIGHEIDFTIADFVADRRAPTPTGAAELLAPVRADLEASVLVLGRRLQRGLLARVQTGREQLLRLRMRLGDPGRGVADRRLALAELEDRLAEAMRSGVDGRRQTLRRLRERTDARSPRVELAARLRGLHALRSALERAGRRALGLDPRRLALAQLDARLRSAMAGHVQSRRELLRIGGARLEAISPERVFERGYSMTRLVRSGGLLRSSSEVRPGEEIEVVVGFRTEAGRCGEDSVRAIVRAAGGGAKDATGQA